MLHLLRTPNLWIRIALLALASAGLHAQTIVAENLGGGCGGTLGYPTLRAFDGTLLFRIQRSICDPNAISSPSVLMIGTQATSIAIPFGPGVAPGCVWSVVPGSVVPIPGPVGGTGISAWLGDARGVPAGTIFYLQALVTCPVHGSGESAVSDAWRLTFR